MRPVGIILVALLAFLRCCNARDLPPAVNINLKVYKGTTYSKWQRADPYIKNTIKYAARMLNKFDFGTYFTLTKKSSGTFVDTDIKAFTNLESISTGSTTTGINMHIFFGDDSKFLSNKIRNKGLRGKMCSEAKYRTLLINRYKMGKGDNQDSTRSARILAYYIGMLLGMKRDHGRCTSGLMHWENWDSGTDKQTWNGDCNAKEFETFFQASTMYSARDWTSQECVLEKGVRLNVLIVAEPGFSEQTAEAALKAAKGILRKESSSHRYHVGMSIDIRPTYSTISTALPSTFTAANNEAYKYTTTRSHDLFVFFTKSGQLKQAHNDVEGSICSTDKHRRIILLDQKEWTIGSSTYKLSKDGLGWQLAYFIARSLGVRYDIGDGKRTDSNGNRCADGFMKSKSKSSFPYDTDNDKLKNMLKYWNDGATNNQWNNCNSDDLKTEIAGKTCLKKARTSTN